MKTMTPIMAKAIASFAAVPSARPSAAPTPARLAAARLRRTESSPTTAPMNGPTSTPTMPKKSPTMRAESRARHGAPRRAEPFHAERARDEIDGHRERRQDAEHDQRPEPKYAKSSAQAASNAPRKINGEPGNTGSTRPSAPMTISTPAAIHSTIVTGSKRSQLLRRFGGGTNLADHGEIRRAVARRERRGPARASRRLELVRNLRGRRRARRGIVRPCRQPHVQRAARAPRAASGAGSDKRYVVFLHARRGAHRARVPRLAACLLLVSGRKANGFYGLPNAFVEAAYGVAATSRNWSTVTRLARLLELVQIGVLSFSLCHALLRTCVRDLMRQPSAVRT